MHFMLVIFYFITQFLNICVTTAWVRIPAWACEKVASDLGLDGGFCRVLRIPSLFTTGLSHELATIAINVTKNEIPNSILNITVNSPSILQVGFACRFKALVVASTLCLAIENSRCLDFRLAHQCIYHTRHKTYIWI